MLDSLDYYWGLGWALVPVPHKEKGPKLPGWQKLRLDFEDLPEAFPVPSNVGVILGEASGGLVDVDLDCADAVELAPSFLPVTWIFGRASKRASHWLYLCPGVKTERYQTKGETLLELRGDGGVQTVIPPSTHPSGERVEWDADGADGTEAPREVSLEKLRGSTRALAAAVLYKRNLLPHEFAAWLEGGAEGVPAGLAPEVRQEVARLTRQPFEAPITRPSPPAHVTEQLLEAVRLYNAAHARELPRSGGDCPVCGHRGCFGQLPSGDGRKWWCFSASHFEGGLQSKSEAGWVGDFLDLDAHAAKATRVSLLKRAGYLK